MTSGAEVWLFCVQDSGGEQQELGQDSADHGRGTEQRADASGRGDGSQNGHAAQPNAIQPPATGQFTVLWNLPSCWQLR